MSLSTTLRELIAAGADSTPHDLVEGFLAHDGLTAMVGLPRSGKSRLAIQLAVSVASGAPFLGRTPIRSGPVLLVNEEDHASIIAQRFTTVADSLGVDVSDRIHIISFQGIRIGRPDSIRAFQREATDLQPALVIVDPLANFMDGDENSSEAARLAMRPLQEIATDINGAVLVTHHSGKHSTGDAGSKMRGSGALHASTAAVLGLSNSDERAFTATWRSKYSAPVYHGPLTWSPQTFLFELKLTAEGALAQIGGAAHVEEVREVLGVSRRQAYYELNEAKERGNVTSPQKGLWALVAPLPGTEVLQ